MKDPSFDYIYDLVTSYEDDYVWWENVGILKLTNYLNNLNDTATYRLLKDSKSWHSSFRVILAKALIESEFENSYEEFVKIFLEIENIDEADYLGSYLEYTEETDISENLFIMLKAKMEIIEKHKKRESEKGKIINLKN